MNKVMQIALYVGSSFLIFLIGLAVYNRLAPRIGLLKTVAGA